MTTTRFLQVEERGLRGPGYGTVDNQLRDAYLPYVVQESVLGDDEMLGDATYSVGIVGYYIAIEQQSLVNALQMAVWASNASTAVEWKVWIRNTTTAFNMSSTSPDASGTLSASTFPTSNEIYTLELPTPLLVQGAQYLFVMFRASDGSNMNMARWLYDGAVTPARHGFPFKVASAWNNTLDYGNPAIGYGQPAMKLLLQSEEARTSESAWVGAPDPSQPILAPRFYGMVGQQSNLYLGDCHSGTGLKAYNVDCDVGGTSIGQQLDECWRLQAGSVVTAEDLVVQVLDPDRITVLGEATQVLDVVAADAAGGGARNVLVIGDSIWAGNLPGDKVLDFMTANPDGVQITFLGTQGTGSNKHEARGGWSVGRYYASSGADVAANPFCPGVGQRFSLQYWHDTGGPAVAGSVIDMPDIVVFELGINDVFPATSDAGAHAVMNIYLDYLDRMIGLTADTGVGSVFEANANAKVIVTMPIMPAGYQDAFGDNYGTGQNRARYKRNIAIAQWRIREHYADKEADGVFLLGWNTAIDPETGWPWHEEVAHSMIPFTTVATYAGQVADLTPANGTMFYCTDIAAYIVKVGPTTKGFYRAATREDGIVRREDNGVHPFNTDNPPPYPPAPGIYQAALQLWCCLNVLVAKALA